MCVALLQSEVISGGVIGIHIDLTLKVRQLLCYFERQVLRYGLKDTHRWVVRNKRLSSVTIVVGFLCYELKFCQL